jgi:hypothetical protein
MTAAERQARRRTRLREAEAERLRQQRQEPPRRRYQPPHGYGRAKEQLIAQGRCFERARREFGFEEGVFIDGAFCGSSEVIALADLPPREQQQWLAERRHTEKNFACYAVMGYMNSLQVSLDELIKAIDSFERSKTGRVATFETRVATALKPSQCAGLFCE